MAITNVNKMNKKDEQTYKDWEIVRGSRII
jgi:hypothetical protein